MLLLFKLKRSNGVASWLPLHRITVSAAGGGGEKAASAARPSPSLPLSISSALSTSLSVDGVRDTPWEGGSKAVGPTETPFLLFEDSRVHALPFLLLGDPRVRAGMSGRCFVPTFYVACRRALGRRNGSSPPQTLRSWAVKEDEDPLSICRGGGGEGLGPDLHRRCPRSCDLPCPA